ncbi:hypothetical protein B484DRAFT_416260 [Ochromonadaceae sp. CCMP2298]|nr:hypothetical protein B484DRAFT_416260 [Ochromonadaceae sp. CCMP2298]
MYQSNKSLATTGEKAKFVNKNLNTPLKSSNPRDKPHAGIASRGMGMAVFKGKSNLGKAVGMAAAPTASLAPAPLNTPSVKRENNGRDPSVNLVPLKNSGVWGKGDEAEEVPESKPTPAPLASFSKPAPWAKPTEGAAGTAVGVGAGVPGTQARAFTAPPKSQALPQGVNWGDLDSDEEDLPAKAKVVAGGAVTGGDARKTGAGTGVGDARRTVAPTPAPTPAPVRTVPAPVRTVPNPNTTIPATRPSGDWRSSGDARIVKTSVVGGGVVDEAAEQERAIELARHELQRPQVLVQVRVRVVVFGLTVL